MNKIILFIVLFVIIFVLLYYTYSYIQIKKEQIQPDIKDFTIQENVSKDISDITITFLKLDLKPTDHVLDEKVYMYGKQNSNFKKFVIYFTLYDSTKNFSANKIATYLYTDTYKLVSMQDASSVSETTIKHVTKEFKEHNDPIYAISGGVPEEFKNLS